jgi:hypothetical protein
MTFEVGMEYVPLGRPKGSRNKRDAALWEKLEARGDKDPAELLSEIASNENEPKELRAQAANWLLPYKYSKRGATPVPPEPSYWNIDIRIQKATTVPQGRENLQLISELRVSGRITEQQADTLFAEHNKILDGLIEEQKLAVAGGHPRQIISIQGGLPTLPGTNIIMPEQNGMNGHAIEGTTTEGPTPGELKAEGPHPLQKHHFEAGLPSPEPKDPEP